MDLNGKILFKVRFDNEIKKLMIHNDDLNYNDLILMLQRIFSDRIKQNDEFTIKYTDDENDLITINDDSDVSLALQTSKILKLTIFLKDESKVKEDVRPAEIVEELRHIRESIDKFLVKFEQTVRLEQKVNDLTRNTDEIKLTQQVNPEVQKEFDPLNKKQDLNQPPKQSRAQTPDSICSNEMTGTFSPHQPQFQQQQQLHQFQQPPKQQVQQQWQQLPQQQLGVHPQMAQQPQLGVHSQIPPQQQPAQQHLGVHSQMQPQQQQQQPSQIGSHSGMGAPSTFIQNPALKQPSQTSFSQPPNQFMPNQQFAVQAPQQQQQQQPNAPVDQQQYYQQQQQQNYPGYQPQPQVQQHPSTPGQPPMSGMNPYSKNPATSLARPPSATLYQQGYK